MGSKVRSYSELIHISGFNERYEYLRLPGIVGEETFGFERITNQIFYRSKEWRNIRNYIITRDLGCDLAVSGREIGGNIYIHHMNPITTKDIACHSNYLLNPEFLICTSHETHNAIHYGTLDSATGDIIARHPNDTCPWKR